jgi:hypothetical protein
MKRKGKGRRPLRCFRIQWNSKTRMQGLKSDETVPMGCIRARWSFSNQRSQVSIQEFGHHRHAQLKRGHPNTWIKTELNYPASSRRGKNEPEAMGERCFRTFATSHDTANFRPRIACDSKRTPHSSPTYSIWLSSIILECESKNFHVCDSLYLRSRRQFVGRSWRQLIRREIARQYFLFSHLLPG